MSAESNELLDAFKAAALSVTKLYKTSASALAKSRADGYQDCLEDLLSFLDRENMFSQSGDVMRIRKWVTERLEGRDGTSTPLDSEDEGEKSEHSPASPQMQRSVPMVIERPSEKSESQAEDPSTHAAAITVPYPSNPAVEEAEIIVPSQETFTFQSSHPYPHDEALRLANLDLSDSQSLNQSNNRSAPRNGRCRNARPAPAPRTPLGKGAGQKRKVNLDEIFDLGSLEYGNGKDVFGGWGKRTRLA